MKCRVFEEVFEEINTKYTQKEITEEGVVARLKMPQNSNLRKDVVAFMSNPFTKVRFVTESSQPHCLTISVYYEEGTDYALSPD